MSSCAGLPQRPWPRRAPGNDGSAQRYPSVYVLQGYTGQLAMWGNRSAYRQTFPEAADAVFAAGDVPPAAFTKRADEHLLMMLGISACFRSRRRHPSPWLVLPSHF
jgi:hypothetical protein